MVHFKDFITFPFKRLWKYILGDPGAVSRAGLKGATKVWNFFRAFSPGPTDRPWVSEDDENSAVIKLGAIQVYYYHYYNYDLFYFYDVVHFIFHEYLRRKRKTKMPVLCFKT